MSDHTLFVVSHTHWDREWYLPFEEFRVRLVNLVNGLLALLDADPNYRTFLLDGQTIILDDYLAVCPEQEPTIRRLIQEERLVIGPWHILPDEFLVAPESTIRNLLLGAQSCRRFGSRMAVGYTPDPFGHISQLPQILAGFDIDSAVFWRGISDAPNEFRWEAPDGSGVLAIHLHSGYGNAAGLPADPEHFTARIQDIAAQLAPTATTPNLLAMNGMDHALPMPELPGLLAHADEALPHVEIRHSSLPAFIAAVRAAAPALETRRGELRNCAAMPVLSGVLSARMWIKQRNAACETLLLRWAEPLTAFTAGLGALPRHQLPVGSLRHAWRTLMENHPHDSICGCSVDQVHREMAIRFDRVEQIGKALVDQGLDAVTGQVESGRHPLPAAVVFNATERPQSGVVTVDLPVQHGAPGFLTDDGRLLPAGVEPMETPPLMAGTVPVDLFRGYASAGVEAITGLQVQAMTATVDGTSLDLVVQVAAGAPADPDAVRAQQASLMRLLEDQSLADVHFRIQGEESARYTFVATDVPGWGYRTFWLQESDQAAVASAVVDTEPVIENEFLQVTAADDGTLTIIDRETGTLFAGLNRFVDEGDRGDEYNFCPVEEETVVSRIQGAVVCRRRIHPSGGQTLDLEMVYRLPVGLESDRHARRDEWVEMPITVQVQLVPGVKRVDITTTVENRADDHRLRVHFPLPFAVDSYTTDGHFDVITRSVDLPAETDGWAEQPSATQPQCGWCNVETESIGLMVANRGLPEVAVLRRGEEGSEIALTLLRAVGWLSRSDLSVRPSPAGPVVPAPEAQCHGLHRFAYSLVPHAGQWQEVLGQAHGFSTPLRAVAAGESTGMLPESGQLLGVSPGHLVLSAVKPAEDGEGMVVRIWNPTERASTAQLRFWTPPRRATLCNMAERALASLDIGADGAVTVPVGAKAVATVVVALPAPITTTAESVVPIAR